ncbi:MAG: hydroxymethylbilane synthase [Gemmatimonadota bacterium]
MRLRVGTRGSALARAQARLVAERLEASGHPTEIVVIKTEGDQAQRDPSMILVRGAFVGTLERALVAVHVDLAVHSAKDLPTGEREGVTVAAYPPRGEARDALVTRDGADLATLPTRARVGTESPRRRAFLLHTRPDLEVVPVRGNVDTRLRALDDGELEGLVLAAAGLQRLGLARRIAEVLALDRMIPAVGQGALAVQTRAADAGADWVHALDDPATRRAICAERRFLAAMGGGCRAPFAAHAREEEGRLVIAGAALSPDGRFAVRDEIAGDPATGDALGLELADRLLAGGAERIAAGDAA